MMPVISGTSHSDFHGRGIGNTLLACLQGRGARSKVVTIDKDGKVLSVKNRETTNA